MLDSRAIALQGVGYASRVLALRGLYLVDQAAARRPAHGPWRKLSGETPAPPRREIPALQYPPVFPPLEIPPPAPMPVEVLAGPGLVVVIDAASPFKARVLGELLGPAPVPLLAEEELLAIALLLAA